MTDNKDFNKFLLSDKMMMLRKDIKPGNGATLLSYQNNQSLKQHLRDSVHLVDDRIGNRYIEHFNAQPEKYAHNLNKQQKELRTENTRLFGRLVSILDVSIEINPYLLNWLIEINRPWA